MIKLVLHKELNVDKWDDCVKQDQNGLFYGFSWYIDLLVDEWDALVYNDYEAVFPLIKNKKFGISYLNRPYGVQQLGVFSKVFLTDQLILDFVLAIPKKYLFIDVFLNAGNPIDALDKKWLRASMNYVLDLNRSYRQIYEGYSKQTIRNLKKAKKQKHRIFEYDSPDQLVTLFRQNKGQTISSLSEENYNKIRQIMHVMLHKRRGYIWTIYDERNTIIAGAFFVEMAGRIVLLFSATNNSGREEQAMTYLLDELFIARAGDTVKFDFEGSNILGLQRFYKGFGATEELYFNLKINRLPAPLKWFKR